MTPTGKESKWKCEKERCPAFLPEEEWEEQTCIFFSCGYGGSFCYIKTLISIMQGNPPIYVPSIDFDEFKEALKNKGKLPHCFGEPNELCSNSHIETDEDCPWLKQCLNKFKRNSLRPSITEEEKC